MEYKPKVRRKGLRLPWGYYVSPFDTDVLLPDPKKLDALNYAFRMKLKHGTAIRSCTMWLHMATGQLMTPAGFMYAYKRWMRNIRAERMREIKAKEKEILKEQTALIEDKYKGYGVVLDDRDNIAAVAFKQAKAAWKKKETAR